MPGSFSWSYKRNYKDSFIWCDLFDDDCILPLSATGEYVLKAMELFDASSPDEEMEYQELRFRSSGMSSPGRSSRHPARPEHRHVENDVSIAIKKSLLLINSPADSMDLNKQIMKNLSYSKRTPEVCSIEHSDVSSSTATYNPTFEETVAETHRKYSNPERHSPKISREAKPERLATSQGTANTEPSPAHHQATNEDEEQEQDKKHPESQSIGRIAIATKSCNAGSQTAQWEAKQRDVTTDCDELLELEIDPVQESHSRASSGAATKRRTWEKEIDKNTVCSQLVYHRSSEDDLSSPLLGKEPNASSGEDPFFFGVLRKATRMGSSFRPRLCRGVDVVESTRIKSKFHFRTKSKHEVPETLVVKSPRTASCFVEDLPQSPAPVKEFKTLSEYFESQERQTPRSICKQIISEEPIIPKVDELPSQKILCLAPEVDVRDDVRDDVRELDPPPPVPEVIAEAPLVRAQSRPFGNEALDASYRKTMEVLAKLPTSRGACRIHTLPHNTVQAAQKTIRSESKGNKQEAKGDTRSSNKWSAPSSRPDLKEQDGAIPQDTCSIHSTESAPAKQRSKASVKKGSAAGFEASTVSGNKQGSKTATPVAVKVEVASAGTLKSIVNEGATGWPFEQPARPRDFKGREDRPLTSMDWERQFQEAVVHSEPPVDLVLHECPQCGRTFKLESLQVHMRGCHGVNKPKSLQRRAKSISDVI
jgi:hypothetical protein